MAARGWPAEDTSVAAALAALEAVAASPPNTPRDEVYGVLRQCAESFRGAHDRATLKAVGTRDAALAALARVQTRALGDLVRRQLCETLCELTKAEGRALVPLLDALTAALSKACKEPKASGADCVKVNVLACLGALLSCMGEQCASRLPDIFSLAKGCPKDSEDAGVRAVSARVLVLLVRHGGSSALALHADALKVCRNLLFDKHSGHVRMSAGDLLAVLAARAEKIHTLGLESTIQSLIKTLGDGGNAHEPEVQHTCEVIGLVLASLATRSGGPSSVRFRQRAGQVLSCVCMLGTSVPA